MTAYKHIDISSIINIDNWPRLDEPLAGSRVKDTFVEPGTENFYIFKQPKKGREAQIWSELIASYIAGDLLNWPVQHTRIALWEDKIGNLLKYIYNPLKDRFYVGEQLCKDVDPNFDPKQGKRHTWSLIRQIHDDIIAYNDHGKFRPQLSYEYNLFWARTIAFDTFISNTDRHAENWAFRFDGQSSMMAPFYDNGSSMGCENSEETLKSKWFDQSDKILKSKIQAYISKGCHHLRNKTGRYEFEKLCIKVLKEFPDMRFEYEEIAALDILHIESLLHEIMSIHGLPESARMTKRRSIQIMNLLHEGQLRVKRCLKEVE